ncbi:carboxypeptidase D precursor-like protein [Euroglyphus maynei]|uniref:Carboxypeptidase D-like protein n=1 Tax=Euroglyphus maynei TaxID=6958 RepID=A0A1Y3ARI6_EURMA|nr:carboxypeptidase D precursor-like protein [Euroglyphus maynei]
MATNFDVVMTTIVNNTDDVQSINQTISNEQQHQQQQQQMMNRYKILFNIPARKILIAILFFLTILISLILLGIILYYVIVNRSDRLQRPKIDKNHHHNNVEINSILDAYSKYYPQLTRLYTIGYSNRNNSIKVLEISDQPGVHEPGEAEIKLVGNIHGNEVVGRELLLHLIDHLLSTYHSNSTIKSLVDNTRIHIAPTINPDGYENAIEGDCMSTIGRYNANGKDLNRNFPDQFVNNVENKQQEIETINIMQWLKQYPFVLSASLHGGALVVNYPFDNNKAMIKNETKCPDDDVFRYLSLLYSKNHPYMYDNDGRCIDSCDNQLDYFSHGITNGAKWYPVAGGMQDWNYIHTNCFELTIEVGCKKYPFSNELESYWQQHQNSLLTLINSTYIGVHGFVNDNHGQSIDMAIISVDGIDKNITTYKTGDYWRLLTPGHQYRITASKSGYNSQTLTIYIHYSRQLNFTLNQL